MSSSSSSSSTSTTNEAASMDETRFDQLGLDDRLVRACQRAGFASATPIQAATIPLALQGRDILAKARTGSGKTAAYLLPVLHKILKRAASGGSTKVSSLSRGVEAIILVPTRDLVPQVKDMADKLSVYCSRLLSVHALTGGAGSLDEQRQRLAELPSIIVATPGRLAQHLRAGHLPAAQALADTLHSVVIDEADMLLSYGYEDDVRSLFDYLPQRCCQTYLMSATLSGDVEKLKQVVLHRPAVLQLEDPRENRDFLAEFCVYLADNDKYLLFYSLLVLKVITGKIIVFCRNISTAFTLKLFLERFGISSVVLNSDLPENSRRHITSEFNRGVHKLLIATDHEMAEPTVLESDSDSDDDDDEEVDTDKDSSDEEVDSSDEEEKHDEGKATKKPAAQPIRGQTKDPSEFGISRGIDFIDVNVVVNFDFPRQLKTYVHRIGRTARAGKRGSALSFVGKHDDCAFEAIRQARAADGLTIHTFNFKMSAIEAFRYRASDTLHSVTRRCVQQARRDELRREILNSAKLHEHFEDNPNDLKLLQHGAPLQRNLVKEHLMHIPDYLLSSVQESLSEDSSADAASSSSSSSSSSRKPRFPGRKRNDPLRSFQPGYSQSERKRLSDADFGTTAKRSRK